MSPAPPRTRWTLAIVSLALFMVTLDNLVVTIALPSHPRSLDASIQSLEWTVNAYTLTFAVLLLTGAALGDRFGRHADVRRSGWRSSPSARAAAALPPSTGCADRGPRRAGLRRRDRRCR